MKWVERAAWAAAIVGLSMRFAGLPGAGVLVVLGFSTAAVVYFPLGWLSLGGPAGGRELVPLSLITGLVLSLLCVGMLFTIQHWPGADFSLLMGLLGAVVLTVTIITLHVRKQATEAYLNGLRYRVLLIGLAGLLTYLLADHLPAIGQAAASAH
ncbi:MAG: hypothetical protein JNL05_04695 [Flavobacteriales bacterium]|nr:hypothetical protein [Flavobacteriales bacterium]